MYNIVQVLWLGHPDCVTTWEPATALSPSLIADYEAGVLKEAASESQEAYGLTATTVVIKDKPQQPAAKKARREECKMSLGE